MTISAAVRLLVRQHAAYACEYCGVSESDSGGELTIDHFRPTSRGGGDDPGNLLYCCQRCNQFKGSYWDTDPDGTQLWNPRLERRELHLLTLGDGLLYALTPTGEMTAAILRLNRPALVAHRRQKQALGEWEQALQQLRARIASLEQLNQQQAALLQEQQHLLLQQWRLLLALLDRQQ